MKSMFSVLALVMACGTAQATQVNDQPEAAEIADALYHCSSALKTLAKKGGDYVRNVSVEVSQLSKGVSEKVYLVTTASGGGFAPRIKGASLQITLTVTQPPEGSADMPARTEWDCVVIK